LLLESAIVQRRTEINRRHGLDVSHNAVFSFLKSRPAPHSEGFFTRVFRQISVINFSSIGKPLSFEFDSRLAFFTRKTESIYIQNYFLDEYGCIFG